MTIADGRAPREARPADRHDGPDGGEADGPRVAPLLLLTAAEYELVGFVLGLVEELGSTGGFNPSELASPSTGETFGPFVVRMSEAMRAFETLWPELVSSSA